VHCSSNKAIKNAQYRKLSTILQIRITNTRYADNNVILGHYFKLCYWLLCKRFVRPFKCCIKGSIWQSMIRPNGVHQQMPLACAYQKCISCTKSKTLKYKEQKIQKTLLVCIVPLHTALVEFCTCSHHTDITGITVEARNTHGNINPSYNSTATMQTGAKINFCRNLIYLKG